MASLRVAAETDTEALRQKAVVCEEQLAELKRRSEELIAATKQRVIERHEQLTNARNATT